MILLIGSRLLKIILSVIFFGMIFKHRLEFFRYNFTLVVGQPQKLSSPEHCEQHIDSN